MLSKRRMAWFIGLWVSISGVLLMLKPATGTLRKHGPMAFANSAIPPPPPISMPVWSLSTRIASSETSLAEQNTSMNIVTFAVPVSVASPKLWAVSLYYNTLTRDSFIESGTGVLQLLTPDQKHLVPVLGKRSGYEKDFSKRDECKKLGFGWIQSLAGRDETLPSTLKLRLSDDNSDDASSSLDLLPGCASYVHLKLLSTMEAGDHELALCEVVSTGVWDPMTEQVAHASSPPAPLDPSSALYTGQLRVESII